MSLSQREILAEMGIAPVWVRREQTVTRAALASSAPSAEAAAPVAADTGFDPAGPDESGVDTAPVAAADDSTDIPVTGLDWDGLRRRIVGCRACGLCARRKQAVPGVGDEQADWLFIGEGPGAEEDARGEPFVGPAGQLLDAMLAAIDLRRGDDVYIANAVKCRPPGNRTPEAEELAACFPYLRRQIALLRPKLIVLLGRAAAHAVLGEEHSMASLRGRRLSFSLDAAETDDGRGLDIPVVATYHPAYLLRNLPDKAKAWEDLCRARALMRTL